MTNHLIDTLLPAENETRPFLYLEGGASLTHGDTRKQAARMAGALIKAGVAPGDRVMCQVAKSAEQIFVYLGTVKAGAVFVPLNPAYTGAEVAYFVENAAPTVLVCDPACAAELAGLGARRTLTLDASGGGTLPALAAEATPLSRPVARAPDDLAAILYTSGTTGRSKGAILSHANLTSNAQTLRALWRFTSADTLLHALPLFHTHGLFVATNICLLAGAAMILHPKLDLNAMLRDIPRVTSLMGVPTFYTRILAEPRFTRETLAHMRLIVSGSAPLLADTHEAFTARFGHRILERYGMTETNMITSNPYDGERRAGTVGQALPGVETRIADVDGAPLPPGEIGTVEVRGPNVFQGYWQMPEKTAEEFRADGFFITGDLGQMSPDGYLTIVGRGKDLVISGGFNVYPKEVEDAVDALPGVTESAVIGLPHPDLGEAVTTIVVGSSNEETIREALKQHLAPFKRPKRVLFVPELPRNTMGKVQKAAMRQTYAGLYTDP